MKKIFTCMLAILVTIASYAQNAPLYLYGSGLDGSTYQKTAIYSDATNGLLFEAPINANNAKLPIEFNWRGGGTPGLKILSNGFVGISNNNPTSLLDVGSSTTRGTLNVKSATDAPAIGISDLRSTGHSYSIYAGVSNTGSFDIYDQTASAYRLAIDQSGNVALGGDGHPYGYKLAVAGSLIAESVTVKQRANWPDYVFEKNYSLPGLSEVENYIVHNHHLPEIPSITQIAKNGVNLGEMNVKLLKKIEELTLYLIEKDKQIQSLQNDVKYLKKNIHHNNFD